jgi:N6-adenosine-specific RNA methylase IME4
MAVSRSLKKVGSRSAEKHYPTMNLADIAALPVSKIAMKNSVLLLWVIAPKLDVPFHAIKAWGFKFKTVGFYWVKQNKKSAGFSPASIRISNKSSLVS